MRSRTNLVALVLAMLVGACGASGGDDPEPALTESSDVADGTTPTSDPEVSDRTESAQPTTGSEAENASTTGAGIANLTIGDMTMEFSGLTCYFGADAAEAFGDDDATFAAVARDGETILAVTIRDKGIDLFEVAYVPGDGSGNWHMVSNDVEPSYTVEEGQITAEGEFDLIIDAAESGTTEFGTLGATCG